MSDNYPNADQPPQRPDYGTPPAYGSEPGYAAPQPGSYDAQQYGAPQHDAQQYGSQQYGAADYGMQQQYGDVTNPYGAGSPAAQSSGKKGLGLTALILGGLALIIGLVLSIWMGVIVAPYAQYPDSIPEADAVAFGLLFLAMLLPTLLGIAAIIMGIVAIVKKNGRGLGIVGLIVAVVAPGICTIAMSVSGAIGAI